MRLRWKRFNSEPRLAVVSCTMMLLQENLQIRSTDSVRCAFVVADQFAKLFHYTADDLRTPGSS